MCAGTIAGPMFSGTIAGSMRLQLGNDFGFLTRGLHVVKSSLTDSGIFRSSSPVQSPVRCASNSGNDFGFLTRGLHVVKSSLDSGIFRSSGMYSESFNWLRCPERPLEVHAVLEHVGAVETELRRPLALLLLRFVVRVVVLLLLGPLLSTILRPLELFTRSLNLTFFQPSPSLDSMAIRVLWRCPAPTSRAPAQRNLRWDESYIFLFLAARASRDLTFRDRCFQKVTSASRTIYSYLLQVAG